MRRFIVEVNWDYAPSGRNLVGPDTFTSRRLIENRDDQIGSVYRKVLYREYTDETFTQQVHVPDWMVYVGPFVKAEEADSVKILFKNMASKGNFSIHPHGFFYDKRGEGARYEDGTSGADKVDDAMRPAGSYLYIWNVTKRHAPTADDDACVPSGNHGHTNPTRDIASGLAGIGFICKKGTLDVDGKRKDVDKEFVVYVDIADENKSFFFEESIQKCRQPDACQARARRRVDREFFLNFLVVNENLSHYLTENINMFATSPATVDPEDEGFQLSYKIRGRYRLRCGQLGLKQEGMFALYNVNSCGRIRIQPGRLPKAETTPRYYIGAVYVEWDYAPIKIHPTSYTENKIKIRGDVLEVYAGTYETVEMKAYNPGTWFFHCHVSTHVEAGMEGAYRVIPRFTNQ
ncbi:hephaestin-like protein [Mya arenaria]|uniref:hephaestin-like protein n=1 Tax=Mya arenaria TaxID=6604 RepID=UPI0022E0F0FF|nr:hephaestin-like protein [Mya arenaria]